MANIDTEWHKNLEKLEGEFGVLILANDKKDIVSRIIKALKNKEGLSMDLNNPTSLEEAETVDSYATKLYELFCEGAEIAEAMMVGKQVEKAYTDIQDEKGNTRDMYKETGHSRGDF